MPAFIIRHSSFVILPLLLAACSSDSTPPPAPPPAAPATPAPPPNPLAFSALTLDGARFDLAERLARRRVVVFFFDPSSPHPQPPTPNTEHRSLSPALLAAERLCQQRHAYNLDFIAVAVPPGYRPEPERAVGSQQAAVGGAPETEEGQAKASWFSWSSFFFGSCFPLPSALCRVPPAFPCVADSDGAIVERYRRAWGIHKLESLPAFYAFEAGATEPAGRPVFAVTASHSTEPADFLFRRVLKLFGIEATADVDPFAGDRPLVPDVVLTDSHGARHRLRDYAGRPVVLVFVVRDCPRCKELLDFLPALLRNVDGGTRTAEQSPGSQVPPSPDSGHRTPNTENRLGAKVALLAVSADLAGEPLNKFIAERRYAFPVGPDPDWTLRSAFRYRGATPDTFVIARDGRISFRHRGYTAELRPILRMEVETLLGLPARPLLSVESYAGDRACRICHPAQFADWTLTRHACAWDTLVRLGKESDPECVACHVTGMRMASSGERLFARGFVSYAKTPHLAGVQCESCHGPNGCTAFAPAKAVMPDAKCQMPDSAPGTVPASASSPIPFHSDPEHRTPNTDNRVSASACLPCHDAVHSPRFDFATYRAKILHDRAAELAALPRAEREARLRRLCSGARDGLFSPDAPYVGTAVCAGCHPTEHEALKDGPHARALAALAQPAPDTPATPPAIRGLVGLGRPECLRCHTTGFARPGGFPALAGRADTDSTEPGTPPAATPVALNPNTQHPTPNTSSEGVGCEACHGPGKAHADDPKKPRAILRLGGTCPECNVLSVCRQCHDDAHSPDFDYRRALPKARHPVGRASRRAP